MSNRVEPVVTKSAMIDPHTGPVGIRGRNSRTNGRAETAHEWIGHVRGAITDAGNRARIDAVIALAEGRHHAARAAIARARAELKRTYDEGAALWARDELDRLAARLPQ